MRYALAVPFFRPGEEPHVIVPAHGERMIGPIWPGHKLGGFQLEFPARDGDDLWELTFQIQELRNGKPVEGAAATLCRLRHRVLGLDGNPLDENGYLAQCWASFKEDARIEDEKNGRESRRANKTEFARQFVAGRALIPWFKLSSDTGRAERAVLRRLQRLERLGI
jgi:hypothetical protein